MLGIPSPVARTPLHHWHAAQGARFENKDGWRVVAAYSQAEREAEAARTSLGVADITSFTRIKPDNPDHLAAAHAAFWFLGPCLEGLLGRLSHLDLRTASFPRHARVETAFAGVEALLVSPAELSLPSVQVYVPWDLAEYAWERILDTGQDLKIAPLGLEALHLLGALPGGETH